MHSAQCTHASRNRCLRTPQCQLTCCRDCRRCCCCLLLRSRLLLPAVEKGAAGAEHCGNPRTIAPQESTTRLAQAEGGGRQPTGSCSRASRYECSPLIAPTDAMLVLGRPHTAGRAAHSVGLRRLAAAGRRSAAMGCIAARMAIKPLLTGRKRRWTALSLLIARVLAYGRPLLCKQANRLCTGVRLCLRGESTGHPPLLLG